MAAIGSPPEWYERDPAIYLSLLEPAMFRDLLAPRPRSGHKGTFGHVLVVAGSAGKSGAAAMSGLGALRAGAGLVTVASAATAAPVIAAHAPELMTVPLAESDAGTIAAGIDLAALAEGKTVVAMGPGLGRHPGVEALVLNAIAGLNQPLILDADALSVPGLPASLRSSSTGAETSRADHRFLPSAAAPSGETPGAPAPGPQSPAPAAGRSLRPVILTPHPGEMSRLTGQSVAEIQKDRVSAARAFAAGYGVTLVLKGQRTVIAFPDGRVWVNPTGTPAMGTGGSGDILTGLIAGFLAQFPHQPDEAVAAAVYLHGLAGEIGAQALGEKCLIATDILQYLPGAIDRSKCGGPL